MRLRLLCLTLFAATLGAQTGGAMHTVGEMHAKGSMKVSLNREPKGTEGADRTLLTKQYHGGLEAEAKGEMLSGGDPRSGTAGYVAFETVTGSLDGHAGSFQVMQIGTMKEGKVELRAEVVPGSGTGELRGLAGALQIDRAANGDHTYMLDYTLP